MRQNEIGASFDETDSRSVNFEMHNLCEIYYKIRWFCWGKRNNQLLTYWDYIVFVQVFLGSVSGWVSSLN